MTKNIVLLSDGTWQRGGVGHETNVWRLYRALVHDDTQRCCYDDGVGSQDFKLLRYLGGAVGLGLALNVRDLYGFLVRHWESGDRIYLFGFSRGAFTVRLLAGMITKCGILDLSTIDTERKLDRLVRAAYCAYRRSYFDPEYAENFRKAYSHEKSLPKAFESREGDTPHLIHFIGVWETVDAMGVPFDELRDAIDKVLRYSFRDRLLSPLVGHGCHALAVDDTRKTFHPVMWDERLEHGPGRIEQVWFAGDHANVGGGHPKPQLALVTLEWMLDRLMAWEKKATALPDDHLRFRREELETIRHGADVHGRLYDPRTGLQAYYRYQPRDLQAIRDEYTYCDAGIHKSVRERIEHASDAYAPHNLPEPSPQWVDGEIPPTARERWKRAMAQIRPMTWLRQWLYFLLLVTTVAFLVLPWVEWGKVSPDSICARIMRPVAWVIKLFTPKFMESWVDDLNRQPWLGFGLIAVFLFLLWSRQRLKKRQRDVTSAGWSGFFGKHRPDGDAVQDRAGKFRLLRIANKFRTNIRIVRIGSLSKGVGVRLVVALFWPLLRGGRRLHHFCCFRGMKRVRLKRLIGIKPGEYRDVLLETRDFHCPTGIRLQQGAEYRIEVESCAGWFDENWEATPEGLCTPEEELPSLMRRAKRFCRVPDQPYFVLLGQVGRGPAVKIGTGTTLEPPESGRLSLYVNDVDTRIPCFRDLFYDNNRGVARIRIRRLPTG